MKRVLAVLLAFAMIIMTQACIAEAEAAAKITIAVSRNIDDHSESFADKQIIIDACKATNVEVEWIEIPNESVQERIPVILASGELPDVFIGLLDAGTVSANSALFMPVNDIVREYAPNMSAFFDSFGDQVWGMCTYPDGNMYSLASGTLTSPQDDNPSLPLINVAWLENLGLEKPTTLDEYVEVLTAFKEEDANGNGDPNDEIPFCISDQYGSSSFSFVTGSFGFTGYYTIRDGKVIGIAADEAYREMIDFFHMLYSEGLMDAECFTQTADQFKAKLQSGLVGVWYGWRPGVECAGSPSEKDYDSFMPPQDEKYSMYPSVPGTDGKFTGRQAGFAISASCENPDAALRFWDYFYKDEITQNTAAAGLKGVTWDLIDGNLYDLEMTPETDPNGYGRAYWMHTYGLSNASPAQLYRPVLGLESNPQARVNMVNNIREKIASVEESLPQRLLTAEAVAERNAIEPDILDYLKSFTANAVINGIDDAGWEKHLNDLEAYSYSEWIDWMQRYYDNEF